MTQTTIDVYCCHTLQVVIHEALMLLKDCCQDTGAEGHDVTTTTSSSKAAALRFIEAVSNTKSLSRPKHINVTFSTQHHRSWPDCVTLTLTPLSFWRSGIIPKVYVPDRLQFYSVYSTWQTCSRHHQTLLALVQIQPWFTPTLRHAKNLWKSTRSALDWSALVQVFEQPVPQPHSRVQKHTYSNLDSSSSDNPSASGKP